MMVRGFATFSKASGLVANNTKSEILGSNMVDDSMVRISQALGFVTGKLPFRYLGMPNNSQRLKIADCEMSTEKIITKTRTWGSRNMSYAAQANLVDSVLQNLHTYWAFIFVIPKSSIKKIIAICRNFLWDVKVIHARSPPISWDHICRDKKEGGIGHKKTVSIGTLLQ